MDFTIADVAKACGVNKQTVRRKAREIGIYGKMRPVDARGTMAMTAEQAAVLSDAIAKASPEALSAVAVSASQERAQDVHASLVEALREAMSAKDALIDEQRAQLERLRAEHESEVASLEEALAERDAEVARLRDYARRLEHAHWWQKRSVIESFGLLPEPRA